MQNIDVKYPFRKGRFIVTAAGGVATEFASINKAKRANRGNCNAGMPSGRATMESMESMESAKNAN